jgi:hypothetical protein
MPLGEGSDGCRVTYSGVILLFPILHELNPASRYPTGGTHDFNVATQALATR